VGTPCKNLKIEIRKNVHIKEKPRYWYSRPWFTRREMIGWSLEKAFT
jgi:hypothetical protein